MKTNAEGEQMKTVKTLLLVMAVLCGFYTAVNPAFAQTWTLCTNAPSLEGWVSVASSADGRKLVAASSLGRIYTSPDSGATWTLVTNAPQNTWYAAASSADGTRLVAVSYLNNFMIYISTDSGVTWDAATNAPYAHSGWQKVASSADGEKIVATSYNSWMTTSTDSGTTWKLITNGPSLMPGSGLALDSIASSADGTKLVAVAGGYDPNIWGQVDGAIYVSTNSGDSWTQTSAPSELWSGVASSADGTKLVAVARYDSTLWGETDGGIYVSTNSGDSWTQTSAPSEYWNSVSSSADGSKLVASGNGYNSGLIYTSTDSGANWTSNDVPNLSWVSVASSADGNKLVTSVGWSPDHAGQIYTSQSAPTPLLNLTPATGKIDLSWIVPSESFMLQQNSDLTSTNWMDVTDTPILNLTNLQNEVILSSSFGRNFYRLKGP
jgi:hypothetical protein